MTKLVLDDCFLTDKDRMSHDEALNLLRQRVRPVVGVAHIAVEDASGRILAEPVAASRPIPAHDNAAVDGYSFNFSDYDPQKGTTFLLKGRAAAGHPETDPVEQHIACRIFTGAVMPHGHDSVVMQEDVELNASEGAPGVFVPAGLKQGANRRLAGEDVDVGHELGRPGQHLLPQDLAAFASAGRENVAVFEPLKVALFATGDEIIRPGRDLKHGQVYDANTPMLKGLLEAQGLVPMDLGILPDDPELVRTRLRQAADQFDVVITSGGASRGEEDHLVSALDDLGTLHMWQIAVKPGRPMAFGQIGDCSFVGLPGNPVAVFVCFLLYVRPLLARLAGGDWPEPVAYPVPAAFSVEKKKPGRREFWRAFLVHDADGQLAVKKYPKDGSGLISSLRAADGLIDVGEDVTSVSEGDILHFLPLTTFGLNSR